MNGVRLVILATALGALGLAYVQSYPDGGSSPDAAGGRFARTGHSGLPVPTVASIADVSPPRGPGPTVVAAAAHGRSVALRDLPSARLEKYPLRVRGDEIERIRSGRPPREGFVDPVRQNVLPKDAVTIPVASFDGIDSGGSYCGCVPPDTVGAVGPTQYVQMTNSAIAVFSKSGEVLAESKPINALFASLPEGSQCRETNDGDPVVVYDQLADRWMVSQFIASAPYGECIAVSTTGDATGDYHIYEFLFPGNTFHDYPHFGLWPDAYYMSTHQFANGSRYDGAAAFAFERDKMLNGEPARYVMFEIANGNTNYGGHLPADLEGDTLPPEGAPNAFVEVDDGSDIGPNDALRIFYFHVDWENPGSSTFGQGAGRIANHTLPVQEFERPLCVADPTFLVGVAGCVPQQGTGTQLDDLGDRLMNRLAYRNFGTHESLLLNHSVIADSLTQQIGPRWYEVRDVSTDPFIHQQGTVAPGADDDLLYRWMSSIAMDKFGNIGLAYSTSSNAAFPSIAYSGQAAGDPLGLMSGETQLVAGEAAQQGIVRWGDYSALTVDPANDCTFWYTTEYIPLPGAPFEWNTRIVSFRFPECEEPEVISFSSPTLEVSNYEDPDTDGAFTLEWNRPAGAFGPDELEESANCVPAFVDDAEQPIVAGSNSLWSADPDWTSQADPNTGTLAYFAPDTALQDSSLTMIAPIALPAGKGASLSFETTQSLEEGYDFGFVEVSSDGGPFSTVQAYTGPGFTPERAFHGKRTIDLSAFAGKAIRIRFRVTSDEFNIGAPLGWYVDNITLRVEDYQPLPVGGANQFRVSSQPVGTSCFRVRTNYIVNGSATPSKYSNVLTLTVESTNLAPIAVLNAQPDTGTAPLSVDFDASATTDPDGDALTSFDFTFGDGEESSQSTPTVQHVYQEPGTYTASLVVTDERGAVSELVQTVIEVTEGVSEVDPFTFLERTGLAQGVWVTSEQKTLTGFSGSLPVSIDNGGQVSIAGGPFAAGGDITAGQTLRVRHVTANAPDTAKVSTVSVGTYHTPFRSRTSASDWTPDAFSFGTKTGQAPGALVESDPVTLTGYNASVAIQAGPGLEYSVNGAPFTASAGTLPAPAQEGGQSLPIVVRHTASQTSLGYTKTWLKVGGVTGYFTTRTQ